MDARAESLNRLLEALEGFETGNSVTVDVDEDLEDSQDVVICYALNPEDEGHVPQGVGAFGSAGTINTYPSSSTCEDRAGVLAPELFLTPPSPKKPLLVNYLPQTQRTRLSLAMILSYNVFISSGHWAYFALFSLSLPFPSCSLYCSGCRCY
ncbi:hypothetical protein CPC08DRAFT_227371 [Agrocybe pediades]|nr:hypothetical protein CPC08DRAFT_227371 [Agrocybe pediades]